MTKQDHHRWTVGRAFLLVIGLIASMIVTSSAATAKGPPPSGCLDLTGDTGSTTPVDYPVHDPAIFKDPSEQTYYVASTGVLQTPDDPGGIFLRRSVGSLEGPWEALGALPVPSGRSRYGHNHLWGPDVVRVGDTFWLYYGVSQLGTQNSAIGVMSTTTPGDLDSWQDHGAGAHVAARRSLQRDRPVRVPGSGHLVSRLRVVVGGHPPLRAGGHDVGLR